MTHTDAAKRVRMELKMSPEEMETLKKRPKRRVKVTPDLI